MTLNLISKQCIVFNYVLNIVGVTVQYHLIKKAEDFIVHIVVTSRAATASSASGDGGRVSGSGQPCICTANLQTSNSK